jgi:FKBP-type peptidyl-prolyl cis-trans isomerase
MLRFLVPLCVLITAGCSAAAVVPPAIPIEAVSFAPSLRVDLTEMKRLPTGVYIRDLVVGDEGARVRHGSRVSVHYAGFLPDGTQVEHLALPSPPLVFEVGQRQVLRGWESGILDMREGGQRQLVIPPSQAYGERQVGRVPPNSTLVFVIKLVSVR